MVKGRPERLKNYSSTAEFFSECLLQPCSQSSASNTIKQLITSCLQPVLTIYIYKFTHINICTIFVYIYMYTYTYICIYLCPDSINEHELIVQCLKKKAEGSQNIFDFKKSDSVIAAVNPRVLKQTF